jgi:dTMP kinase
MQSLNSCRSKIQIAIEAGAFVVVDRYYYSGVVYSVAKDNPALDFQWARHPDEGLPRPDICIFLDVSAEAASARGGGYGEEKYETQQMQFRVRENFRIFLEHEKEMVKIDAGRSLDEVEKEVLSAVLAVDVNGSLETVKPWKSASS